MNELALFAGAGGGILGGKLLGWRTVCAVEIDAYARSVLLARQRDGCLARFPVWDDVTTFDGTRWKGAVDVVSRGFPCQDISAAGKGAGVRKGKRSGLWKHFARIVGEVQPRIVWVENSPMLTLRGLDVVLGDLSALGYDARWGVVSAADAGAPHLRERIWILAHAQQPRLEGLWSNAGQPAQPEPRDGGALADAGCSRQQTGRSRGRKAETGEVFDLRTSDGCNTVADADGIDGRTRTGREDGSETDNGSWWAVEPDVGRVAHGVASRVDRLRCIGNGQVPQAMRLAWDILAAGGW